VAHYQARNYHRINGNTSMHEVTAQVLEALTAVVVVAAQLC
jgi:hypothetical protein